MIKFRLYFDKDAETTWLNEMCAQGWAMTKFFAGFYTFEKCEPGKYIYQIDFREKFGRVADDYRELMNDAGIEIVQCWGYWVILRKKASEGAFELYTDVESQIDHYTKIRNMFKVVTIIELICFVMEVMAAALGNVGFAAPAACLILVLVFVLVNATVKINDILNRLKEEKTGISQEKGRTSSPLLMAGLLINSCSLMMRESMPDYIAIPILLLGIGFMLVGSWMTAHKKAK